MSGGVSRPDRLVAGGFAFLECPRWRDGRIWVSDIYDERVLAIDPEGGAEQIASVPGRPGGLAGCRTAPSSWCAATGG